MNLSLIDTAHGIYQVVNENMISATRVHVAERGADPRTLRLMAFGGAGPVHAYEIARALKMQGFICPGLSRSDFGPRISDCPVGF